MEIQTSPVPIVEVALLAPGRICNILEVEKTLSSVLVIWLAAALRFLLLQLCKEIENVNTNSTPPPQITCHR